MAEEKKSTSRRGRRSKATTKKQEVVDQPKAEEKIEVKQEVQQEVKAEVQQEVKDEVKKSSSSKEIVVGSIVENKGKKFKVVKIKNAFADLELLDSNKKYNISLRKLTLVK